MYRRLALLSVVALVFALAILAVLRFSRPFLSRVNTKLVGERSVRDVIDAYGPAAGDRLMPYFDSADVSYPPERLMLVALKREKRLELWASDAGAWSYIRTYPVCAASGGAGPKLQEGDLQVPEGIYPLTVLNPNSGFHLSIRIEYPNEFDRSMAERDGRTNLGGDIYIHGKCVSIGCLAMGDEAIEELFLLVHDVGLEHSEIIIAPVDMRIDSMKFSASDGPAWTGSLYDTLRRRLDAFRSSE